MFVGLGFRIYCFEIELVERKVWGGLFVTVGYQNPRPSTPNPRPQILTPATRFGFRVWGFAPGGRVKVVEKNPHSKPQTSLGCKGLGSGVRGSGLRVLVPDVKRFRGGLVSKYPRLIAFCITHL